MTPNTIPARLLALGVIFAMTAGCADGTRTTTDASMPPPTAPPTAGTAPVESVQELLDEWAGQGRGGVAVALANTDWQLIAAAAGSTGVDGGNVQPQTPFRVGSLTKTFVAVMLLQLVTDGTIDLDDLVTEHAPQLTIADGVTIRQLLAHRSGIPEHTDSELAPAVLADPARTWTPADVVDLVADQPRDFPPGEQFAYSNTNYVVAGMLLETVTAMTLADNLSSRITEPLGLTSTYFAPDDARSPIDGFSTSLPGGDSSVVSYRALETAAGAAGALVSNAPDLAIFIRALAHGELLDDATYAQMTRGLPDNGHTLGVFAADPATATGISNGGAIPGFTAYMQYDPATEGLFVLLLNDDTRSPEQLASSLLEIVHNT